MKPQRPTFEPPTPVVAKKRCAVYTRKSTDEGLDQEYNSLEAQRDAGMSYIASQRHEGWIALDGSYDDGGFSGGNIDRPGLRRLLADIEAKRVDIVVVYKIDRLTRSLADFAKLVDVFDRNGVSFVSVTQQFNTTTSMGRLTLNILLSFAQFEREVTSERICDGILRVTCDIPKRVSWDQKTLGEIARRIAAAGERVEDYIDVEFSIPESRFNALPSAWREQFEPARTAKPGKPSFRLSLRHED